jgi:7,8-dihydropterin-6-yl-methyl-4-(beta-D-ribofuranosyl)aminobenzene 5'-phosphate synthase
MTTSLVEIDSLEVQVIVDNELDPISRYPDQVSAYGHLGHIGLSGSLTSDDRGDNVRELRMENICCSAHGLSLLIVSSDWLACVWLN